MSDLTARNVRWQAIGGWLGALLVAMFLVLVFVSSASADDAESNADINRQDLHGMTALHFAVSDLSALVSLLRAGADPNIADKDGFTPLHFAAAFGKSGAVVEVLLENGADIDARNRLGETPFFYSVENMLHPNTEIYKILLREGADVNVRDDNGFFAIHLAARWGNTIAVSILLEEGVDANILDESGTVTPLAEAIFLQRDNSSVVSLLLERGANPCFEFPTGETVFEVVRKGGHDFWEKYHGLFRRYFVSGGCSCCIYKSSERGEN